ncbi:MAG: hydroxylamine reductase [Bacteroidales bacterium]|nr:hydroxylamine reductase [Bacteroidales bacterium]
MFCYQCQETAKGTGCTINGVCGKKGDVANLQDLLVYVVKGICIYNTEARKQGMQYPDVDKFVFDNLFATITNANFSKQNFLERIKSGLKVRDRLRDELKEEGKEIEKIYDAASWHADTEEAFLEKAEKVGILNTTDIDIRSLKELVTYGVKGMAAYAEHAWNLGYKNDAVDAFMQKALSETLNENISLDEWLARVMETGKHGVEVMALLDKANTETFGHPEISRVNIGVGNNPGILVSGHDLKDLDELLQQTEGSGVDVYTHSEMLPAHYYPAFKKYKHFIGNYGNSWWRQKEEFETFNGPVLFTTNCLVPPRSDAPYADKVYTTGAAGFDGFQHIADRVNGNPKDFSKIIEHAKQCKPPVAIEQGTITGGFAHHQVTLLAEKIVQAVRSGAIRKFVVMAGCDGRMKDREYYTDFAKQLPQNTIILTAGCAKYRYNKLPLGDIDGIPRVLDAGQCNDSYSLAMIALKLKEAFSLDDINKLPIVYNIAWYEQKAVIVLLALLYLGVKNIHLGPTLPAFLSPNVVKVLVDKFGIGGISTVEADMAWVWG